MNRDIMKLGRLEHVTAVFHLKCEGLFRGFVQHNRFSLEL